MEDASSTATSPDREWPAAAPTPGEQHAMARAAELTRRQARGLRLLAYAAAVWFGIVLAPLLPDVSLLAALAVAGAIVVLTYALARDTRTQRDADRAITRVRPWIERVETATQEYVNRTSPDRLRAWDANLANGHADNVRAAIRQALAHDPGGVT